MGSKWDWQPQPLQGEGEGGLMKFWGKHPESEEEFYASQGIRCSSSFFTSPSTGLPLFTRSWLPLDDDSTALRGVILMVHGYGNDISWTFQWTPIFFARQGFACYALDLPGHGRSYGLKAFLPNLQPVIHDCISYFNSIFITHHQQHHNCKYFLYGESMGGAICLLIHLHLQRNQQQLPLSFDGAILVAPMCKISDTIRPPWPLPHILSFAARFFPTLPIVPTADLVSKSIKVEEKRSIAAANPARYAGKPRLGTVLQLLSVTDDLSMRLGDVTIPFIVLHGSADAVTDPEVSRELYDRASSSDKTINIYPGMMHSLLFGETDHNVERVRRDILDWLHQRC